MPRYTKIYFLLLITILLIGCSVSFNKLKTAGDLMETHPDSALHILQDIRSDRLIRPSDKALYALLMSQALDKNDIKVVSDSLIQIAVDFYDNNEPYYAGCAQFYKARCAKNRGDAQRQANALLMAQEFGLLAHDDKLLGLVYSDKGSMYQEQEQSDSSIVYFRLAFRAFDRLKDNRNAVICLLNTGSEFLKKSNFDSSLYYYRMAKKKVLLSGDALLLSTVYRSIGSVYFQQKAYDRALKEYKKAPITNMVVYDNNKWYLLAGAYLKTNNIDSARFYLKRLSRLNEMDPVYYRSWQTLYEKEGNLKQALYFATLVNNANDSIYKSKLKVSFAGMEKKYNYQNLQVSNQKLIIKNNRTMLMFLMATLIVSALFIMVLLLRVRFRKQQLEIQTQLVLKEKERVDQEKEYSSLLYKQLRLQEVLIQNIEHYRHNAVKRPELLTSSNKQMNNDAFYRELITSMDLRYRNISKRLIKSYPELNQQDIIFCCLLLADFKTGMIATILNIKNDSIVTRRYRLRVKLGLQNSDDLLDFLTQF
ncbi:MAG: tetratricopeptide repeat protein [Paludibacter sp.]